MGERLMLVGFFLVLLLLIDCTALHMISKDEVSDKKQKILQSLVVFFLPIAGALLVILVNKAEPSSNGKYVDKTEFDIGDGSFKSRVDGNDD
jgi:hypothetical protein